LFARLRHEWTMSLIPIDQNIPYPFSYYICVAKAAFRSTTKPISKKCCFQLLLIETQRQLDVIFNKYFFFILKKEIHIILLIVRI